MKLTYSLVDNEALRRLKNAPVAFDTAAKTFLNVAANMVVSVAKPLAPAKTSTLRRSISATRPEKNGNEWSVMVGSGVEYAPYQELGTGIYGVFNRPITPKRAKVLRFTTRAGKVVFAKSVKGVQKKEFMKKGIEKTQDNINVAFDQFDRVIQEQV